MHTGCSLLGKAGTCGNVTPAMCVCAEFVVHADSPEAIMEKAKAFLQDQAKDTSPKGRKARPQEALAKVCITYCCTARLEPCPEPQVCLKAAVYHPLCEALCASAQHPHVTCRLPGGDKDCKLLQAGCACSGLVCKQDVIQMLPADKVQHSHEV